MPTLNAGVHIARITCWHTAFRPRRFGGQMSKAVNDLDTKAGSFA
jgi:hypothetical protein